MHQSLLSLNVSPTAWQRLRQLGNRDVFASLSPIPFFLCLALAVSLASIALIFYADAIVGQNDPPDPSVSTQHADSCIRALTEALNRERTAHITSITEQECSPARCGLS